jgi:hypothetical protein
MTHNPPSPDDPPAQGLLRLASAATLAGISPEIFEAGVANGSIPVAIIQPGQRVRYVRSTELGAWLYARSKSSHSTLENPK